VCRDHPLPGVMQQVGCPPSAVIRVACVAPCAMGAPEPSARATSPQAPPDFGGYCCCQCSHRPPNPIPVPPLLSSILPSPSPQSATASSSSSLSRSASPTGSSSGSVTSTGTGTPSASETASSSASASATASNSASLSATPSLTSTPSGTPVPVVLLSAAPSNDGGSANLVLSVSISGVSAGALAADGSALSSLLQTAITDASGVTQATTSLSWTTVDAAAAAGASPTANPGVASNISDTSPAAATAASSTAPGSRRVLQASGSASSTPAGNSTCTGGSFVNVTQDSSVDVQITMNVLNTVDWPVDLLEEAAAGDPSVLGLTDGASAAQRRTVLLAALVSRVRRALMTGNTTAMQAFSSAVASCTGFAPALRFLASSVAYAPAAVAPTPAAASVPVAVIIVLAVVLPAAALSFCATWYCSTRQAAAAAVVAASEQQRLALLVPVPRYVPAAAAAAVAVGADVSVTHAAADEGAGVASDTQLAVDMGVVVRRNPAAGRRGGPGAVAATVSAPAAEPSAAPAASAALAALIACKQAAVDAQVALFAASMPTFLSSAAVQPPLSGHHIFFVEHEVPVAELEAEADASAARNDRATIATAPDAAAAQTASAPLARGVALNSGFLLASSRAGRESAKLHPYLAAHGFSAYCFHDLALLPRRQGSAQSSAEAVAAAPTGAAPTEGEVGPWYGADPADGPMHVSALWQAPAAPAAGVSAAAVPVPESFAGRIVTLTAADFTACGGFPTAAVAGTPEHAVLLQRLRAAGLASRMQPYASHGSSALPQALEAAAAAAATGGVHDCSPRVEAMRPVEASGACTIVRFAPPGQRRLHLGEADLDTTPAAAVVVTTVIAQPAAAAAASSATAAGAPGKQQQLVNKRSAVKPLSLRALGGGAAAAMAEMASAETSEESAAAMGTNGQHTARSASSAASGTSSIASSAADRGVDCGFKLRVAEELSIGDITARAAEHAVDSTPRDAPVTGRKSTSSAAASSASAASAATQLLGHGFASDVSVCSPRDAYAASSDVPSKGGAPRHSIVGTADDVFKASSVTGPAALLLSRGFGSRKLSSLPESGGSGVGALDVSVPLTARDPTSVEPTPLPRALDL